MAEPHDSPSRGWTAKFIESLRPRAARYELADPKTPGLVLRVHPSGVKSFRWYVRSLGRVVVLGPWTFSEKPAHVTLAQAQDWLRRLKEARRGGEAPFNALLHDLQASLRPPPVDTPDRRLFSTVAEEWYADDIKKNRKRPEDARRILDVDILPVLGARPLESITTIDCRDTVKRTVDRGAAVHAGKVLSTLKQFFGWAQANGFTDKNPAFPLRARYIGVEVNESTRFLSAEEIPVFWRALDAAACADRPAQYVERPDPRSGKLQKYEQRVPALSPATCAGLKVLLLTAVRTGELLRAKWADVDLDAATWTIPVQNQKLTRAQERRAKPFVIPLPPTALALFKELREIAREVKVPDENGDGSGESPWVMAGTGDSGHYEEKVFGHALRRLIASKALALLGGPVTPHDLRRTARTHLAKLRVPHWIVERCLNHSLGKIAATYDQHDYFTERQEALALWDAYVQRLVNPAASNVIPLPTAGA